MFGFTRKITSENSEPQIPYTNALAIIAKDYLFPMLKEFGYTRNGLTFYKKYNNNIQAIINLQANSYNDASESRFYINIGLFHPVMYSYVYGCAVPELPKEYHASSRWRINNISKNAKTEYSYKPTSNIHKLALAATHDVIEYVVPFLESHHNYEDLLSSVLYNKPSPNYYMHTAVYKYLINDVSYPSELTEGYAYCIKNNLPEFARNIVDLAKILGVKLEAKELEGETVYTYTFTIKKKNAPEGDERKSINSLSSRLSTIEYTDKLGYMQRWNPKLSPYQQQFRFYTKQPELFEKKIQSRLTKLALKPKIEKQTT